MRQREDSHNPREIVHEQFPYEFETLERLISKDLSCFIGLNNQLNAKLILAFKKELSNEIEIIKSNFISAVYTIEEERYTELYIQFHQTALIRLAGNLLNYVEPENLNAISNSISNEVLSQHIYQSLQELLSFIETHFSKYFDQNAWIARNYRRIVLQDISNNIHALREILSLQKVNNTLIYIAMLPLENFIREDTSNEVTYRSVIYLKELKKQLFHVNSNNAAGDINESLKLLLRYLNFNSSEFYNYCIRELEQICQDAQTENECIDQLARYQKVIRQTQVKPGFILNTSLAPLKKQLSGWIDKEISFRERRQHLAAVTVPSQIQESDFKIKFDLSVAQVAYFLKVLVAIEIIQNESIAQLLKFFSRIIKTNKAEVISPDSFRNRYYTPEIGAREAIKKLLTRMLAYLNSTEGTL